MVCELCVGDVLGGVWVMSWVGDVASWVGDVWVMWLLVWVMCG